MGEGSLPGELQQRARYAGRLLLGIECAPSLDTPGTHVQGHILCDRYELEVFLRSANGCEVLVSRVFFFFRGICIIDGFVVMAPCR
jgi:hypothetical protein